MTDLIRIEERTIGDTTTDSVDYRDLYGALGIRKPKTDWIKNHVESGEWVENVDYGVFHQKVEKPSGGRPQSVYVLSVRMAEHIAMKTKTKAGFEVREYFRMMRDRAQLAESTGHVPQEVLGFIAQVTQALTQITETMAGLANRISAVESRPVLPPAPNNPSMPNAMWTAQEFCIMHRIMDPSTPRDFGIVASRYCKRHGIERVKREHHRFPFVWEYPIDVLNLVARDMGLLAPQIEQADISCDSINDI